MKGENIAIFAALALGLFGVIGDYFIKISGSGSKWMDMRWFSIGLILYAVAAFGWFYVMKNLKMSMVGVLYALSSMLFLVLLGVFYFREKLNVYDWIGIGLAIASILLLWRFG